jgi:hypothetical protein
MPNTTGSTTDRSGTVTLSNANLTATLSGFSGVRATDKQTAGKFYFEVTATTWIGLQPIIGIANFFATLGNVGGTPTNACGVIASGAIWLGASAAPGNPTLGGRANGDIIGIAVDLDNKLIWFRVAPSGNWNGNAGFAPGGTGGVNFTSIAGGGIPLFPLVSAISGPTVYTANFGDTSFGHDARRLHRRLADLRHRHQRDRHAVVVEEWVAQSGAQVTQIAVEE